MKDSISNIDRQRLAMLIPAKERLMKYTPQEICENAGVVYDSELCEYRIGSLGEVLHLKYPEYEFTHNIGMWQELTILQYLDTADGTSPAQEWIALSEMRGGLSRGRSFDMEAEKIFAKDFRDTTADGFRRAAAKLGGVETESKADYCMILRYAPRFPVRVSFWESDDEFPASGRVHVDRNAEHYLTIEAAGTAAVEVVRAIARHVKRDGS